MGSVFVSVEEAARRLNRTRRSIFDYIKKGFLNRTLRDGKVLLSRDEVEQLAVELGSDLPAMNRKTFFQLQSRLKRLEEQMALVQAVWGAQEKPLRPTEKEAAGLHKAASDYLCAETWRYEEMLSWAGLFNQIDETTLEAVAPAAQTVKPWEVFFDLASRMLEFLAKTKGFSKNVELQALQHKLEVGRRKVREAALFWIESGRGTTPNHVFKLFDTPKEDILRRLGKGAGKTV